MTNSIRRRRRRDRPSAVPKRSWRVRVDGKPTVNRAAIYVKANAGNSPDGAERPTQMDESEELCKQRALDVAARYSDEPRSCQEFQRMMDDATGDKPPFDPIVVWKLRYFAWSLDESILARDKLAASGIRLLSVKEKLPAH